MTVEIWSDVVCPWCYIGKRRFETALGRLAADGVDTSALAISYRAYQLDPGAPRRASMPAIEMYARKFGGPERAAAIVEEMTRRAAEDGIEFRFDRARRANTADAHRLIWKAGGEGSPVDQSRMKELLLGAYFTDGADLGDRATLVAYGVEAGFDASTVEELLDGDEGVAEVAADIETAAGLGITGVPAYVFDRAWTIPGAQDVDVFVQVIGRMLQRTA